jgi:hypothetical protein
MTTVSATDFMFRAKAPSGPWSSWRLHFERQRCRALPPRDIAPPLGQAQAAALAWSLARFQLGETGEGRVVAEVARACLDGVDDDYRRALALFVAEEGRHAFILATLVRALGGRLLQATWTARLFVRIRRLAGLRFKLLALFAAEIVGIGFYRVLAEALPYGAARSALEEIARDEQAHLRFHRQFFRITAPCGWRRALFLLAWHAMARAATTVALFDHRRTLRAIGIPRGTLVARLNTLIREGAQ